MAREAGQIIAVERTLGSSAFIFGAIRRSEQTRMCGRVVALIADHETAYLEHCRHCASAL